MAFISNGTTILDAGAFNVSLGNLVLISEQTASSSSSISFTSGFDSTYPIYKFEFVNLHPATDEVNFTFNLSSDSGSNYNVDKLGTFFEAYHIESDSGTSLAYSTNRDHNGTGYAILARELGSDSDQQASGEFYIFEPSNTTFVKNYFSVFQTAQSQNYAMNPRVGGYAFTTSAVDAIDFKMSSGNIDSGKIRMYGLKDS
jgi:hypothetical protein